MLGTHLGPTFSELFLKLRERLFQMRDLLGAGVVLLFVGVELLLESGVRLLALFQRLLQHDDALPLLRQLALKVAQLLSLSLDLSIIATPHERHTEQRTHKHALIQVLIFTTDNMRGGPNFQTVTKKVVTFRKAKQGYSPLQPGRPGRAWLCPAHPSPPESPFCTAR